MQVAVQEAAPATPTGNLARKVRAVFQNAQDVVQAAAALRKHTAAQASCAQDSAHGLSSDADAGLLREHQAMLQRYEVSAMERSEHVGTEQVGSYFCHCMLCSFVTESGSSVRNFHTPCSHHFARIFALIPLFVSCVALSFISPPLIH
jgi:hypothetical protein